MISACVVPTVKHGGWGVMNGECFAGDTVSDLFRIQGTLQGTLNQHGYSILQWYAIPSDLCLGGITFVFQQENDPTRLQAVYGLFDQEGEWWSAASDDLASTITGPQPNWDGLGWVGLHSEGKVANKCSAYVGTPTRLLKSIPGEAGWENAKSVQRVATLKNLKYILICLTIFWLLHDSICVIS